MATAKSQKEKPYGATPRLLPRPTAASAARAAKNASNRNQTALVTQRQSPARAPPSPVSSKIKTALTRIGFKPESKTEIKINRNCENEIHDPPNFEVLVKQEADLSFAADNDNEVLVITQMEHVSFSRTDEMQELDSSLGKHDSHITEESMSVPEQLSATPIGQPDRISPEQPSLSRPQTPRSISSRPQTPRAPSRPSTPAHPAQRQGTPASRPNTPNRNTPCSRPITPSRPVASLPRPVTPVSSNRSEIKEGDDLKSLYVSKQHQFHQMKKELDLKQQAILEVFGGLRALREHMISEGIAGGGEGCQELVVFNVADWAPEEVAQLCRDAIASPDTDGAMELFKTIDERALADVESKTLNIPGCFADLCLQAFTARQELIDWVKELIENHEFEGNEAVKRIAQYNAQGLELCEALREMKSQADDAVDAVTLLSKRVCRERSTLMSIGESLVREIARLRQDLQARTNVLVEEQESRAEDVTKAYEELRRELEEERAAKTAIKDKLSTTEAQLRQTRLRVSKMDKQLREAEASIASLTGTVKTLEDQSRQREVQLEARARKLKESLKTGEVASGQIAQKRDALQAEVNQLKEKTESMTMQHKAEVQDLNNKLKELTAALEEQKKITKIVTEQKEEIEMLLKESQNDIKELKAQVAELESSKPNPDLPTEREMDLWAELQATKEMLRSTEDEVASTKRDKVRFLETLTKISESDNKIGMQQKLAAELLSKEEIVAKMQTQIRELTKNIKLNEQKLIQYERYIRDLQAHSRAIANCQEAPNGISYQDLQQEILSLRMSLLDSVHRNEELSAMLSKKDQQLEQQDKTSKAQVREELINVLKSKETEQSRELSALQKDLEHRMKIVDEVNKQIAAKADEIQELFATLENKQQQIHRLEKIVLALEEQQRRAQAQRTRHEEKIAALEHEIAAGGIRRERKFIFF
ncbi:myosin-9-like isoform X2 [Maniola jurtina]|uniref:myosin-9-like isoform X2 n=1 Tax=Maniola jurtina TaxID=191418 RepID=UPI001E6894B1|nr:myosin-9-like isoform X2 [Maniola jurtina]